MLAAIPFSDLQVIAGDADDVRSVHAADLNRDGNPDVISASTLDDKIAWYENRLNEPTEDFGPQHVITSSAGSAYSVIAADLDGDGDQDVVSASAEPLFSDIDIGWYENRLNEAAGDFGPQNVITTLAGGARSVFAADVNSDGDPDVLSASAVGIHWYDNVSSHLSVQVTDMAPHGVHNGETVPMLGLTLTHLGLVTDHALQLDSLKIRFEGEDGLPLTSVEANQLIEEVYVYRDVDGDAVFGQEMDSLLAAVDELALTNGVQTLSFTSGDPVTRILGDETAEFFIVVRVARDASTRPTRAFRIVAPTTPSDGLSVRDMKTAEPLSPHFASTILPSIVTTVQSVPFHDQKSIVGGSVTSPQSVHSVDLDGDGDQDVLSASRLDDKIAWYENRLDESAGDFGPQQVITTSADGAASVFASDLDGDGDQDILSASYFDDTIAWYENQLNETPATIGAEQVIATNANGASSVITSDLDGDGDQDVISASSNDNKIAWYENRLEEATRDFGTQQIITTNAIEAISVFASDLDDDGDPDVLSASWEDHKIAW